MRLGNCGCHGEQGSIKRCNPYGLFRQGAINKFSAGMDHGGGTNVRGFLGVMVASSGVGPSEFLDDNLLL